jgi:antitoxin ParD1/3/4
MGWRWLWSIVVGSDQWLGEISAVAKLAPPGPARNPVAVAPLEAGWDRWYETLILSDMIKHMEEPPMPVVEKRTISLPPAQAHYIDSLVESGGYASASEVVRAGLRALQERDAVVERWLKQEVVPVYDAMLADPGRGLSADQATAAMRAHHAGRLKKAGRDA